MALILPVFCLIGFGLMDVQFCLERTANLEYIVQETARCQALNAIPCSMSPGAYALHLGETLRMYPPQLVVVSASCVEGVSCSATLTYHYQALGVWFPDVTLNRSATAAVPPLG